MFGFQQKVVQKRRRFRTVNRQGVEIGQPLLNDVLLKITDHYPVRHLFENGHL